MRKILSALALLTLVQSAQAAPATFALTVTDGKMGGPGAEILRAELPKAQFILYGEDHGFADSPIVLRAIAHEARPFGFKYHAVEVGPVSMATIRGALKKDGIDGVHKLVDETPLGFPFLSLKDDALLASDYLGEDAKGTPYLWGLDQEFIGSPGLHLRRLVAIAPNDAARAAAQKLLTAEQDAAAKGDQGNFLLVHGSDADFDALAAQFKGSAEALNIIAEMKESAAVYQLWMNDHNYENNARRARLLAKNFLADYHAAADPQPKVIFKMGAEHTGLGTTTINTVDLGTLASKIAQANGKTALRILFLPTGGQNLTFAPKPGNPTSVETYDDPDTRKFFADIGVNSATLSKTGWTVIPLEPVRQALDNKGLEKLSGLSRFMVLGFDYVITTPDAKPAVSLY